MSEELHLMKHNDLPISNTAEDKLGFGSIVKKVAIGIKSYEQKECFIISIEGEWGAGKTSFMKLLENEIKDEMEIMHFNPWLISNIEQLIAVFFKELIKTISRISFKAKLGTEISEDLKKFASAILPDQISVGLDSTKASWKMDKYFKPKDSQKFQTLYEQKKKINEYLGDLDRRILIIIDDIDRLMDQEIELVFRLIKGIADFNNITYVLLFDKVIVSKSLEKFKAEKGSKYLDKVVQYTFSIPKPHSITIKNILFEKLDIVLNTLEQQGKNIIFDTDIKWSYAVLTIDKYIKNIRDVNKIVDIIRFEYPIVCEDVEFTDFFVITMLRIHAHELYDKIKKHPDWFIIDRTKDISAERDADRRVSLIKNLSIKFPKYKEYEELLKILFPIFDEDESELSIYAKYAKHDKKMIADPYYFENYFSFTVSPDKISYRTYIQIFEKMASEDYDEFEKILLKMDKEKRVLQFIEHAKSYNKEAKLNDDVIMNIILNLLCISHKLEEGKIEPYLSLTNYGCAENYSIYLAYFFFEKSSNPNNLMNGIFQNTEKIPLYTRIFFYRHIKEKVKKKKLEIDKSVLDNIKEKLSIELKALNVENLFQTYNGKYLVDYFEYFNISIEQLSKTFADYIFESKNNFFKVLEAFKYLQLVSTGSYWVIYKEGLGKLVEINKIEEFIKKLNNQSLSEEEQKLLEAWKKEPVL